jgi:hypothetical protein
VSKAVALALAIVTLAASFQPSPPDAAAFTTNAKFSIDRTTLALSSVVATIEPRPNAPDSRWLLVHFYAFSLTPEDIASARRGNVEPLDARWKSLADKPAQYNVSSALLQLSVGRDASVWQIDLAVPGHTCTIAPSDRQAKAMLQDYRFDGTRLRLKTRGNYLCHMNMVGEPDPRFGWDVDVDVPVFAAATK